MREPHPLTDAFQSLAASRSGRFARGGPAPADEDERLVDRAVDCAKNGDTSALQYLYVRYADDVQRYVNSIVQDRHDAEDITQNVFAKLMTAIGQYERRRTPFRAWIMRVARNAALDHVRSRRLVPCEEIHVSEPSDEHTGLERGVALKQALHRLPEEQRQVLVLRQLAGLTPAEVADLLGKSEGSIHGLHHRGRRTLKSALRELESAPVVIAPGGAGG
jgi:RNA polymerase sigma-70 factor (ECF subfamily)